MTIAIIATTITLYSNIYTTAKTHPSMRVPVLVLVLTLALVITLLLAIPLVLQLEKHPVRYCCLHFHPRSHPQAPNWLLLIALLISTEHCCKGVGGRGVSP